MIDTIKKVALAAVESKNPVNLLHGTVVKSIPLEIEVHQRLKLTKDFLMLTQTAADRNLIKGDKVVMIRMQGGQLFLIIDKAVNP